MSPHNLVYKHVGDYPEGKVFEIDTTKSHFFGIPWKTLGSYGKKKFENLIVLHNPRERLKFIYR